MKGIVEALDGSKKVIDLSFIIICLDHLSAYGPYDDMWKAIDDAKMLIAQQAEKAYCNFAVISVVSSQLFQEDAALDEETVSSSDNSSGNAPVSNGYL